ncbi:MAG: hypothetical protein HN353_07180 [Bdellovibrionales bacterium]|jgi:hypothetical protein|nr:hypothetical protein [Bdellovibrionales bacterium]MBT3526592.1 hypothetical protein [Bdellovibrionales bacterium]MBT7670153.1 hypothetical protein [Bdellovibrionales bacterium]MBT7768233.1 hypothetical protein [Bdellovibrionales bacterium]
MMKTFAFIGLEKNAGKTTAFNYLYLKLLKSVQASNIALTSVGVNGEEFDQLSGRAKPNITIKRGSIFITRGNWLATVSNLYSTHALLPSSPSPLVIGQALVDLSIVLEGPNDRSEALLLKQQLTKLSLTLDHLLLDGSIDRHFIAHPQVSDRIYCSLPLPTSTLATNIRAMVQLYAMNLSATSDELANCIQVELASHHQATVLIIERNSSLTYHSTMPTIYNQQLTFEINRRVESGIKFTLYLNGALTTSLALLITGHGEWIDVVLDNFTCFCPAQLTPPIRDLSLTLLHPANLEMIFIKQQNFLHYDLPWEKRINLFNIFRDNPNAIKL